jgi:hypothetical protein
MYVTDEQVNLQRKPDIRVTRQQATVVIPPDCIFTLKAILKK